MESKTCLICYNLFGDTNRAILLKCGHTLCKNCYDSVKDKRCPFDKKQKECHSINSILTDPSMRFSLDYCKIHNKICDIVDMRKCEYITTRRNYENFRLLCFSCYQEENIGFDENVISIYDLRNIASERLHKEKASLDSFVDQKGMRISELNDNISKMLTFLNVKIVHCIRDEIERYKKDGGFVPIKDSLGKRKLDDQSIELKYEEIRRKADRFGKENEIAGMIDIYKMDESIIKFEQENMSNFLKSDINSFGEMIQAKTNDIYKKFKELMEKNSNEISGKENDDEKKEQDPTDDQGLGINRSEHISYSTIIAREVDIIVIEIDCHLCRSDAANDNNKIKRFMIPDFGEIAQNGDFHGCFDGCGWLGELSYKSKRKPTFKKYGSQNQRNCTVIINPWVCDNNQEKHISGKKGEIISNILVSTRPSKICLMLSISQHLTQKQKRGENEELFVEAMKLKELESLEECRVVADISFFTEYENSMLHYLKKKCRVYDFLMLNSKNNKENQNLKLGTFFGKIEPKMLRMTFDRTPRIENLSAWIQKVFETQNIQKVFFIFKECCVNIDLLLDTIDQFENDLDSLVLEFDGCRVTKNKHEKKKITAQKFKKLKKIAILVEGDQNPNWILPPNETEISWGSFMEDLFFSIFESKRQIDSYESVFIRTKRVRIPLERVKILLKKYAPGKVRIDEWI